MYIDKEELLNDSDSFCILPWIAVHKDPSGVVGPCCVSNMEGHPADESTVEDIAHSDMFNELRSDMLAGKKNSICDTCYKCETANPNGSSPRKHANWQFKKHIDVIDDTQSDGTMPEIELKYLDVRFSNLCSMKCRSCSNGFSSLWETEDRKHRSELATLQTEKNFDQQAMLGSVVGQIQNIEVAYFAGGEPLITKEHYTILKEFISQGRTDVKLRYNTNIGNLDYKGEDLVDLWAKFDNRVEVYASIDHYGDRAEIIRHGVKWDKIKENYARLQAVENIDLHMTTTITALNYTTMGDFLWYMFKNDLMPINWQPNIAENPSHLHAYLLPKKLKVMGFQRLESVIYEIRRLENKDWLYQDWLDVYSQISERSTYHDNWDLFTAEMKRLDDIRDENVSDVFPELAEFLTDSDEIAIADIDFTDSGFNQVEKYNLKEMTSITGTLCALPWVHVHQTPHGFHGPCCISEVQLKVSNTVEDLINSDYMKDIRVKMLSNEIPKPCQVCKNHEDAMGNSNRLNVNIEYADVLADSIKSTQKTGYIPDFKMKYFDLRFSNICNMKCRSCTSAFSSLWEKEDKRYNAEHTDSISVRDTDIFDDVIKNYSIDIEKAYFAGGEPLVTDEHYALLNKFISMDKTDVVLLYNTNVSVLQYKNYDIMDLWSKFDNKIDISASIDHIGAKAEYIRHGTKWPRVLENLQTLGAATDLITLGINTVVSVHNYMSLDEFVKNIIEEDILSPHISESSQIGFYPLTNPSWQCIQILPLELKRIARKRNEDLIQWLVEERGFDSECHTIRCLRDVMNFAESADTWEQNKDDFRTKTKYYDLIRDENFEETFPELLSLMHD